MRPTAGFVWGVAAAALAAAVSLAQGPSATLTGLAILPANTFADGPPSGAWRERQRRGRPEFRSQPVQGFSSLRPDGEDWLVLGDNGFGTRLNSGDALLRMYRLRLDWAEHGTAPGMVAIETVLTLSDPARRWPWRIVREGTKERWLTGGDLDPESFVRLPDGSFWVGEEFGPFLVHVNASGELLSPPLGPPGLRSPDHPDLRDADRAAERGAATVAPSRGFEGLARDPVSGMLYAALEAGPAGDPPGTTRVIEVDPVAGTFGRTWRVPLEAEGHALTELVSLSDALGSSCPGRFLMVERDNGHGPDARFKRVYGIRLLETVAGGPTAGPLAVEKRLVADLLDITNPAGLGGFPARFTFPFITTEAFWPIDTRTLVLVDDNNFPAGGARPGYTRDPSEFIRLRLGGALSCR
ncbi:MAG: esterase-like activity of phytase family protein [Vicinamibacterales bacterium]